MFAILQERYWVVHTAFICIDKFKFLAQFVLDHFAHLVVSSLILFLCKFAAFTYYVIDGFVSITTSPTFAVLLRLLPLV